MHARLPLLVKGRRGRPAAGTAGLPPAPEYPRAPALTLRANNRPKHIIGPPCQRALARWLEFILRAALAAL